MADGSSNVGTGGNGTGKNSMRDRFLDAQNSLNQARSETTAKIEHAEKRYCSNRVKVLSRVWILTQICTVALVISGFAVGAIGGNPGYGFMAVDIAVLAIVLSVVGALILRKYRTPWHHGILLGLCYMMANTMLINAVAAGTRKGCTEGSNAAEAAVGAFSVFLFFLYLTFAFMLHKWREDIIGPLDEDDAEGLGIEMNGEDTSITGGLDAERDGQDEEERSDLKMV